MWQEKGKSEKEADGKREKVVLSRFHVSQRQPSSTALEKSQCYQMSSSGDVDSDHTDADPFLNLVEAATLHRPQNGAALPAQKTPQLPNHFIELASPPLPPLRDQNHLHLLEALMPFKHPEIKPVTRYVLAVRHTAHRQHALQRYQEKRERVTRTFLNYSDDKLDLRIYFYVSIIP